MGNAVPKDGTKLALGRSEEHTSELQSQSNLVCRLLLEKKKTRHCTSHCSTRGHSLANGTPTRSKTRGRWRAPMASSGRATSPSTFLCCCGRGGEAAISS